MNENAIKRAIDTLMGWRESQTVSRQRVEAVLRILAQQVETDTKRDVLMALMTTEDVAQKFGITARRVRAIAKRLNARGITVGWNVPGTAQWLFLPEEIEILRPGPVGNPAWRK